LVVVQVEVAKVEVPKAMTMAEAVRVVEAKAEAVMMAEAVRVVEAEPEAVRAVGKKEVEVRKEEKGAMTEEVYHMLQKYH
jgi:hypothetical protein